jgi:tRNA-guanine family transglycosylase
LARGDNLPGMAVGGLAGGESKDDFVRVVSHCTARLPDHKPRYVMGVGYPLDLVLCTALGADMYDCVYPSRTARFGTALVPEGVIRLKSSALEHDHGPIDKTCDCLTCKNYTRAQLHAIATKEPRAAQLLTIHNLRYQMRLCAAMHQAIVEQRFADFVRDFVNTQFPNDTAPDWVRQALKYAEIEF